MQARFHPQSDALYIAFYRGAPSIPRPWHLPASRLCDRTARCWDAVIERPLCP